MKYPAEFVAACVRLYPYRPPLARALERGGKRDVGAILEALADCAPGPAEILEALRLGTLGDLQARAQRALDGAKLVAEWRDITSVSG